MSALRRGLWLTDEQFEFSFDGRRYPAQRGDTAASALLAAGVRAFGRSIKYRRLRGLLSAGPEEPNALLAVGQAPAIVPNVPAPVLQLRPGLELASQNCWPTLHYDLASLLQLGGGFFGAGFYYKTFIWPSWRAWEGIIRRLAGQGPAPAACTLPAPAQVHLACDVLVAGAGPAGLAAALAATRAGARVIVCERECGCGGELDFEAATIDGVGARSWLEQTLRELATRGARVLTSTAVLGGSDGSLYALEQPGGLPGADTVYRIRPRAFVIAMGAVERPIAFIDNDRPGVMLLGSAERLLARYGALAGSAAVLFGNHDRLYPAAARLEAGGLRVRAVIDTRPRAGDATAALRRELARRGVPSLEAHTVLAARGRGALSGVSVAPLGVAAATRTLRCDTLLVSGGWSPAVHAGLHEGGSGRFDPTLAAFAAGAQPDWRSACGAANGRLELAAVLADGHAAGVGAARAAGCGGTPGAVPSGTGDAEPGLEPYWRAPADRAAEKRQFVDLQNDVTVADLRGALAEGFIDIEHVKRYTALGVGTEQGRTSAVLGAAILAELSGRSLAAVGLFRTRPPYQPVTLRALAGFHHGAAFRPERRTPLHDWHLAHGGELESTGYWLRPRYYRGNGADAYRAGIVEAARVRQHGGIVDGSTLGKLEIAGAEAAAFLDRLYLTRASTIKPGRSKYMVNLREDGMVLDDGLVLRLAADRFLATTSSGHAGQMLSHFEFWRDTEWAGRAVTVTDVTEAWAVIACAGPASRGTLERVLGSDWQPQLRGLTHMALAEGQWGGAALRVLRASFSGELAFELHCRPESAAPLWEALHAAGLEPYGLEALDILRVEKGYLVSSELSGQTTPYDLGMEALVALGNPCVGSELLDRAAFHEPGRPRLVGVRAADGRAQFQGGAQLARLSAPQASIGYVTSAVYSPTLGEWVGLALLARAASGAGALVIARDPLRGAADVRLKVTAPVHFDPAHARMKA